MIAFALLQAPCLAVRRVVLERDVFEAAVEDAVTLANGTKSKLLGVWVGSSLDAVKRADLVTWEEYVELALA